MDTNLHQPPEMELISLYGQLWHAKKGTDDYIRIQTQINRLEESIDAHAEITRRVIDAFDQERLQEFLVSVKIFDARFQAAVDELFETDLTQTEMLRLSRLLHQKFGPIIERVQKSKVKQKSQT
jgi:hypothetical protein